MSFHLHNTSPTKLHDIQVRTDDVQKYQKIRIQFSKLLSAIFTF